MSPFSDPQNPDREAAGLCGASESRTEQKEKSEKNLMLRCIISTLAGEGLDALFFITIAFIGTMPITNLLVMIVAQAIFKTLFEVVVYPITKLVIKTLNNLPE